MRLCEPKQERAQYGVLIDALVAHYFLRDGRQPKAAMMDTNPKPKRKRYHPTYDFKTLPDDALLPIDAVAVLVGLAPGTIRNKVRNKTFPEPDHLSRRVIRWRYGVVKAWIHEHGTEGAPAGT